MRKTSAQVAKVKRRATRGTAEQRIVDAAIEFFAQHGFHGSTRDLARELGVTQALLYRYFRTKQNLIDRVFEEIVADRIDTGQLERLAAPGRPLAARLTAFYQAFAKRASRERVRLFMRAGLDDQDLAVRYTYPLNDDVLWPVIGALRREAGLPPPQKKPILRAERELVMTLHGAVAHLGLRRHVYASPLPDDLDELIAFYVKCFLGGAVATMKRLHARPPRGHLGEALAMRPGGPIE